MLLVDLGGLFDIGEGLCFNSFVFRFNIGQRYAAHIQLAHDHVGDKARVILADEVDFFLGVLPPKQSIIAPIAVFGQYRRFGDRTRLGGNAT